MTLFLLSFLVACKEETQDTSTPVETWECDADHDDWERCEDGVMTWCHADVETPHFHASTDCAADGYVCAEREPGDAVCVDEATSCNDADASCGEGIAYNCLDGKRTVERCSLSQACHLHEGVAQCEDADEIADEAVCDAFVDGHRHEAGLVQSFDEVFSSASHAPLNEWVTVELPEQADAYLHFPVAAGGTYRVLLDHSGILADVSNREGVAATATSEGALEACPTEVPETWTANLAGADSSIPYVLHFSPVPADTLVFMVHMIEAR